MVKSLKHEFTITFQSIKNDLSVNLHFLSDKPEESVESTLKAGRLAAS